MIFVTSTHGRPDVRNFLTSGNGIPEPLVSLPRDQETTDSGDENGEQLKLLYFFAALSGYVIVYGKVAKMKKRISNIDETISKDKFKQILRRFSKGINNFSFSAPMIANKHNDYVYF